MDGWGLALRYARRSESAYAVAILEGLMGEQADEIVALLKKARPPCPVCNWPLWPIRIDPIQAAQERRAFLCPRCDYEDVRDHNVTRHA